MSRKARSKGRSAWLVALGGLVVVGAAVWLLVAGPPVGEVTELLSEGGEKVLREPMRAARGTPRVLVFALDGVGNDELLAAVRSGGARHMAGLLGAESGDPGTFAHGYAVPNVLSVLPSTTLAAWAALFTGVPAAHNGVPGNEWFAREEMKFYAPAPVSVQGHEHAVEVYSEDLLGAVVRAPTLYEQVAVRSYVSLAHVHRGADLLTVPSPAAIADLAAAAVEGVIDDESVSQEAYAELDLTSIESLLESIREHGIADLQVVYFPGVDLYTHVAEGRLADQRRYLREVIDSAVGRVLAAYAAQNALDDTYVVIVADHGHTPVLSDDRHALGTDGDDEPPAVLRRAGFRMRPFVLEVDEDEQDFQATVAYQGAFAYVYLADRSTCPLPGKRCDWTRPPRWDADVLPVVRAFDAANRDGTGVPAMRGTLELILAREPRAVTMEALPFDVWDGTRLVPIAEYLTAHPLPELLELESRLRGLAAGPFGHRAGDVLLLARSGAEVPIEERYYFSGKYRSWHGSPSAQDSRIPLVVARRGGTGLELRELVRQAVGDTPDQLDVVTLIRALLGERASRVDAPSPRRTQRP